MLAFRTTLQSRRRFRFLKWFAFGKGGNGAKSGSREHCGRKTGSLLRRRDLNIGNDVRVTAFFAAGIHSGGGVAIIRAVGNG